MPSMPPRACRECGARCKGRYCTKHAALDTKPAWSTTRTSAHARGYGSKWRELRQYILNRDPICTCGRAPSKYADHIRPKHLGGTDDPSNLQGLCRACHDGKTQGEAKAAQARARARAGGNGRSGERAFG